MGAMENWGLVIYREVDLLVDSVRASSQQKQRVAEVVAHGKCAVASPTEDRSALATQRNARARARADADRGRAGRRARWELRPRGSCARRFSDPSLTRRGRAELAHQWFGNMVTMQWWSSLWLNEGFASYMQTHCCSKIFPEWSMWEQWVISSQAAALRMDALATSHPIQVPIKRAEEVEQVFDAISYYKGACVVRLIYSFLGKQDFDKGLQAYMLKHKYGNTETEDLWQAWEDASGKPMRRVMASWTDQMGFPLLTVRALAWAADMSTVTLDLEQRWFLSDGSEQPESASKLWSIPLLVTMGDGDALLHLGLMDSRKLRVTVRLPNRRKTWIKLNGGQHVPMRVNYEPVAAELGPLFAEAILGQTMAPADRAGMLLDAYALAKAGFSDPGTLVRLLTAYENETTMPVFSAIEDVLTGLRKIVLTSEARPELRRGFERFGARVIAKACKRLGWDATPSDGHLTVLLRATLIRLQAQFMQDSTDVQRMARERFEAFSKDPKNNAARLPSDIRTAVLKIVLGASDDAAAYNRCMELIDLADTTQAKKEIFLALGNARSEELKRRTLDWCTSGAVKKQDFFYPIGSVSASSRAGMELTWQYLQDNWSRIVDMIRTASPSLLEATVSFSCSGFASETKAAEIERFFKDKAADHPVSLITRKVAQIVEVTRANAKFLQLVEKSEAFAKVVASE
jgi:puromycin-sensitive aminopeptidase